jgi:hypothetical protein
MAWTKVIGAMQNRTEKSTARTLESLPVVGVKQIPFTFQGSQVFKRIDSAIRTCFSERKQITTLARGIERLAERERLWMTV